MAVDNATPFYNVYGGTQDNNTLGGPSRNTDEHGIRNEDWFVTVGGDGFQSQVDPNDPDIVYSESQNGGLVRFDRKTGEVLDIQPQPGPGEPAALELGLAADHQPALADPALLRRQPVFRSDDRGDTWTPVSPDLTRQLDRNQLKVMGRVWSVDAVAKNASTSFYGNIVALAESPAKEGLLFAGTDDGLIQVTEDGGANWRQATNPAGVPEMTYVSRLTPSAHGVDVLYAAFDNHKRADFKPYVLKSTDLGRTWTSIAGDLPERGTVYALAEDPVDPDLLFAGTEFGLYFTLDGGRHWMQLNGGMPTIAVRDLAIQQRENDLVAATFGRGFYVLDDYPPLRSLTADALEKDFLSFAVKPAWMYVPSLPLSTPGKAYLGDSYFTAPNPPFGAVFTYYLRDEIKTRRKARLDAEKEKEKKGEDTPYPDWEALRKEDREEEPAILLTVTDEDGGVVRRLTGPVAAGFQRVAWDLRYPARRPHQPGEGRAVAVGHPGAGSAGGAGDLHGVVRRGGRRGDHPGRRAADLRRGAARQRHPAGARPRRPARLPAEDRAPPARRARRRPRRRRGADPPRPPEEGAARHPGRRRPAARRRAGDRGAAQGSQDRAQRRLDGGRPQRAHAAGHRRPRAADRPRPLVHHRRRHRHPPRQLRRRGGPVRAGARPAPPAGDRRPQGARGRRRGRRGAVDAGPGADLVAGVGGAAPGVRGASSNRRRMLSYAI